MPVHQLCVFLNSVSRAEGIPDLGFRIAGRSGIESLGLYGRLVMQAFTMHEFVQRSIRWVSAYNSGIRVWTEPHGPLVKYCQRYDKSLTSTLTREVIHLGLANALSHAGLATRSPFIPRRIELPTAPIDLTRHFPQLKALPLEFNRSLTAIWFDRRLLSQPLRASDESITKRRITDTEQKRFIDGTPSSSLLGQLEQIIESSLGWSAIGLQTTASIVGTSPRTLQRRLAVQGIDYSRLLQSVRFRTAQRMLRDPEMPLAELARRLSYADLANFIRAFKRWTGIGPGEFRRIHLAQDSGQARRQEP